MSSPVFSCTRDAVVDLVQSDGLLSDCRWSWEANRFECALMFTIELTDKSIYDSRLTVWTGFSTSICAYDAGIMLCIDMSHKVLRSGTVLDLMMNLRQRCEEQHFMEICAKEIVGLTVLTK